MTETTHDTTRWSWAPTGLAVGIALVMLGLAGAPLDAPGRWAGSEVTLLEPAGAVDRFPTRFAWTPVEGADQYEITVVLAGGAPLFRQRGSTAVLDLSFEEGAAPGPGEYHWQVVALRDGRALAQAAGAFRVAVVW